MNWSETQDEDHKLYDRDNTGALINLPSSEESEAELEIVG